jgi:hypothetical protein
MSIGRPTRKARSARKRARAATRRALAGDLKAKRERALVHGLVQANRGKGVGRFIGPIAFPGRGFVIAPKETDGAETG